MKRILVMALGALLVAGGAIGQTSEWAKVAKERAAIDSIAASCDSLMKLNGEPTPVAVTEAFPIFSGIQMIAGVSTPTVFNKTRRTYPITGGMQLDGAKSVLLQFSASKWTHGGFVYQVVYGTSATDTGAFTYGTSWCDSISMDDSLGVGKSGADARLFWEDGATLASTHASRSNPTFTKLLTGLPGAGYLFIRVWPHLYVDIHIHDLGCTARKVE